MEPKIGDQISGDILVRKGNIEAVEKSIADDSAIVLDGKDHIVLPGLIDTHWHMWTSLLRSMAGDKEGTGYFETTRKYGKHFQPEDMYQATRLAAMEAVYSGITTVHDWSHNVRSLEHAEMSLKGLNESGLRARYSCGTANGQDADEPMDFQILEQLQSRWKSEYSPDALLTLGIAWRGVGGHPGIDSEAETGLMELKRAREMGIPLSVHASAPGIISRLMDPNLMGPDVQIVHGMGATKEEIRSMVDAGSSISVSPYSELRIGYGFPPVPEFEEAGAIIGLSVDTTTLSGNADMFAIMKIILNMTNALEEDEYRLSARQVLEMATLGGAKSLGISDITGSISPGKRADLLMVDTKAPNMGFITDPVALIVEAAQPSNVSTVMVDGKILKQYGRLTHFSEQQIYDESKRALEGILDRGK
jgi:5-methylthioadenosine/S-adenosylhomocysteine deaminase